MDKIRIMSVFGTRPEAIKMCPLVKEIQNDPRVESIVCVTAQHREMLDQVLHVFGVKPDYDLNIMKPNQTLSQITTRIINEIEPVLKEVKPDIVLVHGDTTTSYAVALAAFYQQIPVGHVEAGLRTYNMYSPFPEEMNRVMTSRLATLHFAPTPLNKANLIRENVVDNIFVTGNTVLDAFKTTVHEGYSFKNKTLKKLDFTKGRYILLTAHRRENIGEPLEKICNAVKRIIEEFPDVRVIYPVHMNPSISDPVHKALGKQPRIFLLDPLDVTDLHNLMAKSTLVLTDSGGLQEEGPSFKKPVLVLRTETERPEAVEAGCVRVIGVKEDDIVEQVGKVLNSEDEYNSFLKNGNPYGDGNASKQIVDAIFNWKNPFKF
ncbi:MAG: UDP-N-acetylglucosamine 2-epimerase (non-hydrolyzing) [Oscillospiraceae bacterium]